MSCAHFTCQQGFVQNPSSQVSAVYEPRTSICTSWIQKKQKEEPEIKFPTFIGSQKKAREFQRNIYFCFIDYSKVFDCVDHNKLWKILKEIGLPDHLTCLLRNLYVSQEATEPDMKLLTGSKWGKKYNKAVCCYRAYLTYMQSTSCEMLIWMNHKLESRFLEEIATTSDMQIILL